MLFMIVILVGCGSNSTNNNNNDVGEQSGGSNNIIQDDVTVKPDPAEQKDDIVDNNGNETEPEKTDDIALDDDRFIALFYGEWSNKEDQSILLELQEGSERVGIKSGDLLSQSEFSIIEVNAYE